MIKAELLYRCADMTGESATWLQERESFLWVDIDRGILHRLEYRTMEVVDCHLPEMVTSIIPWSDHEDEVILAMKNRLVSFNLANESFRTVVDLASLSPDLRTNDCKACPSGRIWCGIMGIKENDSNGFLFRIDNNLAITKVLNHQSIPNGIVWNASGDRMYYADSGRHCVEEFSYSLASGEIAFVRTALHIPENLGVPDGMTIDMDGNLWIAHWGGGGVYIWNPDSGVLIDTIEVPVPNVASCTFGGKDGRELFITTAIDGLTKDLIDKYPLSGSLFIADVPWARPGQNHYPFIKK